MDINRTHLFSFTLIAGCPKNNVTPFQRQFHENNEGALFLHMHHTFSLMRASIRPGTSDINMSSFCGLILDQTDRTFLVSMRSGYPGAVLLTSNRTIAQRFSIGDRSGLFSSHLFFSQNAGKFDLYQSFVVLAR